MATFKVGDRVRVKEGDFWTHSARYIGRVGKVVAVPSAWPARFSSGGHAIDCDVRLDGDDADRFAGFWQLEPLTDSGAEKFLESIRNMKPYDESKVPVPAYTVSLGTTK